MTHRSEFADHPVHFPAGQYRGFVRRVIDGDTLDVLLDLGFLAALYVTLRLKDFNTPELRDPDPEVRADAKRWKAAAERALLGRSVIVTTERDVRTFGRWVAEVHVVLAGDPNPDTVALGAALGWVDARDHITLHYQETLP